MLQKLISENKANEYKRTQQKKKSEKHCSHEGQIIEMMENKSESKDKKDIEEEIDYQKRNDIINEKTIEKKFVKSKTRKIL